MMRTVLVKSKFVVKCGDQLTDFKFGKMLQNWVLGHCDLESINQTNLIGVPCSIESSLYCVPYFV